MKFPTQLNILKEAQRRSNFSGFYPASAFTRLKDFVEVVNDVKVELNCDFGFENKPVCKISLETSVGLRCMRCFEPIEHVVKLSWEVTPVKDDTVEVDGGLPYIPLPYNELGFVDLFLHIEDEIIISLPINPKHELADCKYGTTISFGDDLTVYETKAQEQAEKDNPFAALEALRGTLKK